MLERVILAFQFWHWYQFSPQKFIQYFVYYAGKTVGNIEMDMTLSLAL